MTTPAAEETDVAETALTDRSVDVAVVRHALVRNEGDLAVATGFATDIDPMTLARDMTMSYDGAFNTAFFTAVATFATNVGSTGVNMSHDDFMDAIFQLELSSVPGPFNSALSPRQFADWQESLRAEGGAIQFHGPTAEMLGAKGQGFAGSFLNVGVWKFSDVVSGAADDEGGMWGPGTFKYKTAIVTPIVNAGSAVAVRMDELLVEITRNSSRGLTEITGAAWFGIVLAEQARGVGIVTDAP